MDSLAQRYLGYDTIKYEDVAGKGAKQIPFSQVALDDATRYAAEDADVTLRLHRALSPKLAAEPALERVYRDIEMPLVPVLDAHGGQRRADRRRRTAPAERRPGAAHARRAADARRELAGRNFNLDSPKQLGALLFEELKLPALVKTPTGQPSTNEEALEAIADQHELPRVILEYRGLAKLRSTYTDKLPEMVNPRHRPRAHQLPPGRRGDRAAVLDRPEPAEHPDPHRGRPPHPHRVRRAAGPQDRGLRLLADRAADHGAPVRGPGAGARVRSPAPTSTAPPPRKCSA